MLSEPRLNQTIRLKDGRQLGFAETGDPQGRPVIYCHGFPASRLEAALVDRAASARGARIIAPDRPGYGLSDHSPARRITDWPGDMAELADQLNVTRFSVLAVSGGAPYGLALLHGLPERTEGAGIVAGLGPVYDPEAVRPMHGPARFGFTNARRAPWLMRLAYGALLGPFMRAWPDIALALLTTSMREADRATLACPDTRATLCASIREALRPGMRGALLDFVLYAHDWGFDLAGISLPVDFWHGTEDSTVPFCHSRMLAGSLPRAQVIEKPGEGHFSLPIQHAGLILGALLNRQGQPEA
jgi:pimeloyl-ACP methyl ester carboxylesterase